ncbi:MAG TPA: translation initiation factor IF-2 [Candidatus Ornithomonoglobus merdipullorum]|mgnify:CR=1 FL=1|uniref:Translation initiation factor IF-2 n=1 Tax=Candidatus Ornithomonoglobus merdipullorum TaxID=2840895 RepID=A0A9D1MB56_9FIRM|nr:translation initiation factor IF-2 [Candidatus Ornithomonoglobus merdipullorum]
MAETSTTKLGDITKKFKAVTKDVITQMADYGEHVKSASSSITDDQAAIVVDIITKESEATAGEIKDMRNAAVKAVKEKKEKAKREAEEKEKAEKAAQEAEAAAKAAAKKAAREKADAEQRAKRKAEEKAKKEKQKKHHNLAKKQSGVRVDLSNVDNSNTSEEYVIKSEKKSRTVDTRTSNVDLDKLEKSERLEKFADDVRVGKREKNKNKKNDKRQDKKGGGKQMSRRNERDSKKQQRPKPKVITEISVPDTITVGDFAAKMGKGAAEVVKKLMLLGIMATVNQSIDFDTAELIADEFGIKVNKEIVLSKEDILLMESEEEDKPEDLVERPPVVVVMGHVDHGKTSLLDAIRHTSVISTEAGGITQHIGAYSVKLNDRTITFLDTPGHEAFTTMRARGAQVTDVAILVVAADDGIMPQTVEAINHAKAANVDIIVAINKIDKENANVERVKQSLMEYGLVPEEWGGDTICVEISAKKKINIDGLLEMVLLVADMKELKANPNRPAKGTVIEARVDKGKGPVATVLVQNGTLRQGDTVICGTSVGHVRAMTNDKGRRVKEAGPSMPVEIQGLNEAPSGGDELIVVKDEKLARDVAEQRKQEIQENKFNSVVKVSLDNLFSQIDEGNMKELDIIVKADVQGSVEAVKQSLEKLSNDEVRVRVIHGGVGAVNESDVMLASASNAIIVGFNVRPDAGAIAMSEQNEVDIRLYRVIYQAIEEIEAAMKGMLDPEYKEVVLGYADVRQTFRVPNVGIIAGCYVTQGKIVRNASVRVVRDGIIIHEGKISSLKRFKDDAKEVTEKFECGIGIDNFNDVKEGDTIECFEMQEIER